MGHQYVDDSNIILFLIIRMVLSGFVGQLFHGEPFYVPICVSHHLVVISKMW